MQWARAWVPATKATALFVLPIPLLFAFVAALVSGDVTRLGLVGGALASLWGAGVVALRALVGEARFFLGERPDPPALPLKLLSAIMTMLGVSLAAVGGGHTLVAAVIFAVLALLGHVAFYGRDLKQRRIEIASVEGVDSNTVVVQLKEAYGRLRAIETASQMIALPEFREQLARITSSGRSILGEIERDPRYAARARRFLSLYLESAEHVTLEYSRTHGRTQDQPLEQNFRKLLGEMENTFAEQHKKLLEHDLMALDVDIEVLNARLKQEGLG